MKHRRLHLHKVIARSGLFANPCLITLVVLEIQSAIRAKRTVLTHMLELLSCCTGLENFD
jgi:hypothetical protein